MTVRSDTFQRKLSLDTPFLASFVLNWELVLYTLFFAAAVFTRFYHLGDRVMSHDESLHTLYSWKLYAGQGYQHDPLMHGPSLFHITALMYFLFGDNDFTARLGAALFGIAMVVLPYWFRPWLGRVGALAASFGILISPALMYYSRYIRHDTFLDFFTLLMILSFFQYMRTRQGRWLYLGAAAVSLMLSTMEAAYIHGFIGFTFILLTLLWENLGQPRRFWVNNAFLAVIVLLLVVMAYLIREAGIQAAAATQPQEPGKGLWEYIDIVILLWFMVVAAVLVQRGADQTRRPVTSAILSIVPGRLPEVGRAALLALIIFILLHTTLFSNVNGIYTGSIGALSYWLSQHNVQRGGQPWYYYLFLVPMYEFLPVLVGLIGGLVYVIRSHIPAHADSDDNGESADLEPADGGTFGMFTIYWAILAFAIYSWAGEKMPWLSVHMTLPMIFLSAHVIQTVLGKFDLAAAWRRGGPVLFGVLLLVIPALAALLTAQPFRSQSLQSISETLQFITALVVLGLLVVGIWYYGRRLGRALAGRVAFITALFVLVLLTIRFAWMLSFINYDYVNEILVYAHGGPDVKLALSQIDDISRRTVGDKMIKVAYDNDSTWPLEWYMREYPNRAYYGENPTRDALDAPVVIVGDKNESKVKPFLGDRYSRYTYRLVWWPMEDYKNQTPQKLWENYVVGPPGAGDNAGQIVRDNWRKIWRIFFYRDYEDYDLNQWPYVHRFYMYVRKDVLNDMWDYQSGPVALTQAPSVDPYQGKRIEVQALQAWGSNGSGNGQFVTPRSLAVGPDGRIYVADTGNHRIQVFDQVGQFVGTWGSQGSGPGQFNEPWGVAVAPDGSVFVADTWNHRVQVFTAEGQFLRTFGTFANVQQGNPQEQAGNFWGPRDLAFDPEGNLYVTDTGNKRVEKFTAQGQFLQTWGGGGITPGSFEEPTGIDIDSQGNIYVADTWNRRVQKFDRTLAPVAQWEVVSGWQSESVINKPFLAVDAQDRVFISDPEGYRIIAYTSAGELLGTWGQYGQDLASFALPLGLDFDNQGNILVADSDNNRIMKFAVPDFASVPANTGGQ